MYYRNNNSNNRQPQRRFSTPNRRFSGRGIEKKLDERLFVRKAEQQQAIEAYIPTHTFADFAFSNELKKRITERGYTIPTPIQDQAIPYVLQGQDVVGLAQTGTGKTAVFLLPLIDKVLQHPAERVLIIAPTRELAVQIQDEFKLLVRGLGIMSVLCIGGASLGKQIFELRRHPQFVVGTPGRLKDLSKQGKLHFSDYTNIVLDEVDRMLDMGFINDIKFIIAQLPEIRHSLFFSATMPDSVRQVMQSFLHNPITVKIKSQEAANTVDQDIIRVAGRNKIDVLHDLLSKEDFNKVIIFGRTKWGIDKVARELENRGFRVAAIHGNKNQNQRQRALESFKQEHVQALLATDIAARGLDIPNVSHVINYDPPTDYEDYIHRIGRTGRANKKGIALTFVE